MTIIMPRPWPPSFVVKKGSKMRETASRSMPTPVSRTATQTNSSSASAERVMTPPRSMASMAFLRRLKKTCLIWLKSPEMEGMSARRFISTRMPSCVICSRWRASTSPTTLSRFTSLRSGARGRMASRKCLRMSSSRRISAAHTSTDSASFSRSGEPASFARRRCMSCRWMLMELSGLPTSCATPAASMRMEFMRSSSISSSVQARSSVTSSRMMTNRRPSPSSSSSSPSSGVICTRSRRFSG